MTSEMTREFDYTGIRDHRFNCRKKKNIYNKQDRLGGIGNKQALEFVTSRLLTAMLELFTTKTFTTPPAPVGSTLISASSQSSEEYNTGSGASNNESKGGSAPDNVRSSSGPTQPHRWLSRYLEPTLFYMYTGRQR